MKQVTITLDNYEEYIIDFVEHTLSEELNDEMISFLNLNPAVAEEVMSFRNIKLVPDMSVEYPDTSDLLLEEPRKTIVMWKKLMAVACIGLLMVGGLWYGGSQSQKGKSLEVVEHTIKSKIDKAVIRVEGDEAINQEAIANAVGVADEVHQANSLGQGQRQLIVQSSTIVEKIETPSQVKQGSSNAQRDAETYGPQLPRAIETRQVLAPRVVVSSGEELRDKVGNSLVLDHVEFLPSLGVKGIDQLAEEPGYDIVFTVVIPKKDEKLNIIKSKLTGSFAFANTSMAFLPTFINSKKETLNN